MPASSQRNASPPQLNVPWVRSVTIDKWLVDQNIHSYIAALAAPTRRAALAERRRILEQRFGSRPVEVPYETSLWIADKTSA